MSLTRREFMQTGAAAALALGAGGLLPLSAAWAKPKLREYKFTAAINEINLGVGNSFKAWTFNGAVPGPAIRATEGETIRVTLLNRLPEPTTIHWHGLPVPNAMDGVPGVTQKGVAPGASFVYEFPARPAGTFIYHSHQGYQLDRGLYGSLIIDPVKPEGGYDREYSLLLEDWATVDGGGPNAPNRRPSMGGMMGRGMMGRGMMGGGMQGRGRAGGPLLEPIYNAYAVNGKVYPRNETLLVKKGDKVRLRIANPSALTIYDLRLAGHQLVITHADANPVIPMETDVLRIAPGERYDVQFIADNPGRWLLMAADNGYGESGLKVAVAYQGVTQGEPQPPVFHRGLRLAGWWNLRALKPQALRGELSGEYQQTLSGGMHSLYWTINGRVYPDSEILPAGLGKRLRLTYVNRSPMPHPMHLHGHFFSVVNPGLPPASWIKKDTILVSPMQGVTVDFYADNPGRWFHHCHNLYHMEAGMANLVDVSK